MHSTRRAASENLALETAHPSPVRVDLDATTSWFVLAWDAFKAPVFRYDEALRLAAPSAPTSRDSLIGRLAKRKARTSICGTAPARGQGRAWTGRRLARHD